MVFICKVSIGACWSQLCWEPSSGVWWHIRSISEAWKSIIATCAMHLLCYLAKTWEFIPFSLLFYYLLLLCHLVFFYIDVFSGFIFFPFMQQVFIEHSGARALQRNRVDGLCRHFYLWVYGTQKLSSSEWASERCVLGCPVHGLGADVWVQNCLLGLWTKVMGFPRRNGLEVDLLFGKQKSRESFSLGKREGKKLIDPLDPIYMGVISPNYLMCV